jgi:hypothetical protein
MPRRPSRASLPLLTDTSVASADVIAARMRMFADPSTWGSASSQREAQRMLQEKLSATSEGAYAAWVAMARMPLQAAQSGVWLAPWQPQAWWRLWSSMVETWMGLGNAALRPATRKAVANQRRLRAR